MENRIFNILIIEDIPLYIDGYRMFIGKMVDQKPNWEFRVKAGRTCDKAIFILENQMPPEGFDLAILDYNIKPSSDGKYVSGEDIAGYIRRKFPIIPILFNVDCEQPIILGLLKSINPEGLLHKTETTSEIIKRAITEILYGGSYYGKSVLKTMKLPFETDLILDEWDRKLLYELGRGTKTTHIPDILPLSLSSVSRRKKRLKEIFEVEGGTDRELLERARELGFL